MPGRADISKGEGLIRTHDLLEYLIADVNRAFAELEDDKSSQYLRRTTARSVFAFVEGVVQILKFEVRSALRKNGDGITLNAKDHEVMYEEREKDGKTIPVKVPIEVSIKRLFRVAPYVWGIDYCFDAGDEGYRNFLLAKKARNRLTHPRTYYDIEVTDFDMSCYAMTFIWLRDHFRSYPKWSG